MIQDKEFFNVWVFERCLKKVIVQRCVVKLYDVVLVFLDVVMGEYWIVDKENKYGSGNIDWGEVIGSGGLRKDLIKQVDVG